jgi:Protein of unknown function (DUF1749)
VSDREFVKFKLGDAKWDEYVSHASRMVEGGRSNDMVPREYWKVFGGGPCSAYRFLSLTALGVIFHNSFALTELRV